MLNKDSAEHVSTWEREEHTLVQVKAPESHCYVMYMCPNQSMPCVENQYVCQ